MGFILIPYHKSENNPTGEIRKEPKTFNITRKCALLIFTPENSTAEKGYITTSSGLQYKIIQAGNGQPAKAGDEVLSFETTSFLNGEVLHSNENSDAPIPVLIGGNQATTAMDEALRGMQVGEIRQIIAPPE